MTTRPTAHRAGTAGTLRPWAMGLAALIREETRDGAELVAFALTVLRAPKQPTALRMAAAQWLADRGFGTAAQTVAVDAVVDAAVTPLEALGPELTEADAERIARRLLEDDRPERAQP